jgi:hypothetical protein
MGLEHTAVGGLLLDWLKTAFGGQILFDVNQFIPKSKIWLHFLTLDPGALVPWWKATSMCRTLALGTIT